MKKYLLLLTGIVILGANQQLTYAKQQPSITPGQSKADLTKLIHDLKDSTTNLLTYTDKFDNTATGGDQLVSDLAQLVNDFKNYTKTMHDYVDKLSQVTPGADTLTITDQSKAELKHLVNDFKNYTTSNLTHAGNLYEHSVWTAHILANWFAKDNFWVRNIDKKDKNLTILAGLLHDIGKAGDRQFTYFTKPDHPDVGFQYLVGAKKYYLKDGSVYNFWRLGQEALQLSPRDAALLAISVGMHWAFGGTTMACQNPKKYVKDLISYASQTQYGKPDLRLLYICMAVSAADTTATLPAHLDSGVTDPFNFADVPPPAGRQLPAQTLYGRFDYATYGESCYLATIKEFNRLFPG